MTNNELIERYITLRDLKSQYKAEYEAKVAKLDQVLEKIEQKFLQFFNESGGDTFTVRGIGTAYRTTQTSASVADRDAFLNYVKDNDAWHLLETRCAKKAVEEFRNELEELPPGVNWSSQYKVSIRRSN